MIRLKGVVIVCFIVIMVIVLWVMNASSLLSSGIKFYVQSQWNTPVEFVLDDYSLSPLYIKLLDVAVVDTDSYDHNLMSIESVELFGQTAPLYKKRLIIDKLVCKGVAFNQLREDVYRMKSPTLLDSILGIGSVFFDQKPTAANDSGVSLQSKVIDLFDSRVDVSEFIDLDDLQGQQVFLTQKTLVSEIDSKLASLVNVNTDAIYVDFLSELSNLDRLDLTASIKHSEKLEIETQYKALLADYKIVSSKLNQAENWLLKQPSLLDIIERPVSRAYLEDREALLEELNRSMNQYSGMTALLFASNLSDLKVQIARFKQSFDKNWGYLFSDASLNYMPQQSEEGYRVKLLTRTGLPLFWLKDVELYGKSQASKYVGSLTHFTSDLSQIDKETSFFWSQTAFTQDGVTILGIGSLTKTTDGLVFSSDIDLTQESMSLIDRKGMIFKDGFMSMFIDIDYKDEALSFKSDLKADNLKFSTDLTDHFLVQTILSSVNSFQAEVVAGGSLDHLSVDIRSDLDSKFEFLFNTLQKKRFSQAKEELFSLLSQESTQSQSELMTMVTSFEFDQRIQSKLTMIQSIRDQMEQINTKYRTWLR